MEDIFDQVKSIFFWFTKCHKKVWPGGKNLDSPGLPETNLLFFRPYIVLFINATLWHTARLQEIILSTRVSQNSFRPQCTQTWLWRKKKFGHLFYNGLYKENIFGRHAAHGPFNVFLKAALPLLSFLIHPGHIVLV